MIPQSLIKNKISERNKPSGLEKKNIYIRLEEENHFMFNIFDKHMISS